MLEDHIMRQLTDGQAYINYHIIQLAAKCELSERNREWCVPSSINGLKCIKLWSLLQVATTLIVSLITETDRTENRTRKLIAWKLNTPTFLT